MATTASSKIQQTGFIFTANSSETMQSILSRLGAQGVPCVEFEFELPVNSAKGFPLFPVHPIGQIHQKWLKTSAKNSQIKILVSLFLHSFSFIFSRFSH